jgi:glutaredoxin
MKSPIGLLVSAVLFGATSHYAHAVTIYKCVDESGSEVFSDRCPPGSHAASESEVRGSRATAEPALEEIASRFPVVFYAVPDCDACDLVRNQLEKRGIPFTEKNAATDLEIQNELRELVGALTVPAVSVADQIVTNYNKAALDSALDEAGYPPASAPAQ